MKKKNIILSIAAASTLLIASPLTNKVEAASSQPTTKEVKVYYQTHNLSKEDLDELVKKYSTNYQIDIDSFINQLKANAVNTNKQPVSNKTTQPTSTSDSKTNTTGTKNNSVEQTTKDKQSTTNTTANENTSTNQSTNQATTQSSLSAFEQQVVDLTNNERAKYGLAALKIDTDLSKVARAKSQDMSTNNYFDHNSPNYGSPFDMMKSFGISYKAAGENIAKGQTTPEEVVKAWMNSEGHRANILSEKFTHIGVGYVKDGNYWTQQFIGK